MKLQHGKTYLNRKGEKVTVHEHLDYIYPFKGDNEVTYTEEGKYLSGEEYSPHDLVKSTNKWKQPSKEQIIEVANNNTSPEARETLKLLFPDVFKESECQKKTPEQWFRKGLPNDIAELAIANIDPDHFNYKKFPKNLDKALIGSFHWESTMQKYSFWNEVHDVVVGRKKDFPTIPKKNYWSKPSDLPSGVVWIKKEGRTGCSMINDTTQDGFYSCGVFYAWKESSLFRWLDRAFENFNEGKECICEI